MSAGTVKVKSWGPSGSHKVEILDRPTATMPAKLAGRGLAVARPAFDDVHWCIIHVPTGLSLGTWRFTSTRRAVACLRDLLDVVDWPSLTEENFSAMCPEKMIRRVNKIHERHGAVRA